MGKLNQTSGIMTRLACRSISRFYGRTLITRPCGTRQAASIGERTIEGWTLSAFTTWAAG
jgi:hypothetical protein